MKEINHGLKVHYISPHGSIENGIIKSFNDSKTLAFVVYNCNGDWENYHGYTAAATNIKDLTIGWYNHETKQIS